MHKSLAPGALLTVVGLFGLLPLNSVTAQAADIVAYAVDEANFSVPQSLTGAAGDAVNGRAVAIDRKKGNCLACHELPVPEEQFHGRIGPPLAGVGGRYDAGQLRLRVANSKAINPLTIMPAFYRIEGLHRVGEDFQGQTILSAQEVEDVVAYLATLK